MGLIYSGKLWMIQRFISGFSNNSFLVTCKRTNKSIIIDTPADPADLLNSSENFSIVGILITHGHYDHLEGFKEVYDRYKVPVGIGNNDINSLPIKPKDYINVDDGSINTFGDLVIRSIETPGHTSGSTCYFLPGESPGSEPHLFSGDTLFPGGPGKSLTHENFLEIVKSITTKLYSLPNHTHILPGHGEFITLEDSIKEFEEFNKNPLDNNTFGNVKWIN